MNKEQRLQYWKSIIDECYAGEEPVISWCSRKGVNESCFYKWRRIIYPEYSKSAKPDNALFAPVVVDNSYKNVSLTVNGVEISFEDSLLERIVGALK
ncbi:IS66 family insertion sequence element accessory protein TnpA [Thomasclavelia cocleata]|nr:hypothetical protein [Thomasclavelia cocleata]MCI9131265.1 hypothetical protein [Thomasclavelia cocleata]MCR1961976.1 hypothetical protein [Thomasclavelia cocleata]NDO42531.1 hypothetical protein [Thomasclavelia cocleata]